MSKKTKKYILISGIILVLIGVVIIFMTNNNKLTDENISKKYPTTILVHAHEGKNVLLDIISKTSNTDINVVSINTLSTSEDYLYELIVSVPNVERLNKFIDDIRLIPNIIKVERIIK